MTTKTTLFAVLEKDFEYNDETYNAGNGGLPKKLFSSKAKAEAYAVKLTINEFPKEKGKYGYATFIPFEASEDFETFKFNKNVCDVLDKYEIQYEDFDWDLMVQFKIALIEKVPTMTEEEKVTLFSNLVNPLYEVYEVEFEHSTTANNN